MNIALRFLIPVAIATGGLLLNERCDAQSSTTGAIEGKITDPQGRLIVRAAVNVCEFATNECRSVETNAQGQYIAPLLPVGLYRIEAVSPGFAPYVAYPVSVRVTETSTFDMTLKPGMVKETVTVQGESGMVQNTSSTLGGVVDSRTIDALPLATRNYVQLMVLSPGVLSSVPNATALGLNGIELSAQGGRLTDNSVNINGVDAVNYYTNTLASYLGGQGVAVPAPDSLEEFKVQTALYDASTGRNGGANIAVVTKSGTNEPHGSAYYFFRNDALNANDFFFNRAGQPKPVLRQGQFGATFGGPIRRNTMFYFLSYQGTRQKNGAAMGTQSSVYLPPLSK